MDTEDIFEPSETLRVEMDKEIQKSKGTNKTFHHYRPKVGKTTPEISVVNNKPQNLKKLETQDVKEEVSSKRTKKNVKKTIAYKDIVPDKDEKIEGFSESLIAEDNKKSEELINYLHPLNYGEPLSLKELSVKPDNNMILQINQETAMKLFNLNQLNDKGAEPNGSNERISNKVIYDMISKTDQEVFISDMTKDSHIEMTNNEETYNFNAETVNENYDWMVVEVDDNEGVIYEIETGDIKILHQDN